jgi:hypothetical protein
VHLIRLDLHSPLTRGERLPETKEGEEVKISSSPSEPETLSLGRVEKIKGVVKDLSVGKRDQRQIIAKIASGVDWNNQLVVVMCFVQTSASIHVMLQSVFLKGFTAARSKRSFFRCSFKVLLGRPIESFRNCPSSWFCFRVGDIIRLSMARFVSVDIAG